MIRSVQRFLALAACFATAGLTGCVALPHFANETPVSPATRTVLFVPGVFGDGPWYDGLREGLVQPGMAVKTVDWGMPKALFIANFSNVGVHAKAEAELAAFIDATTGTLDLVGHSAGCGGNSGALAKAHRDVGHVILIAPSVSPHYDLGLSLSRTARLDVFHSERDTFFLKWRCGTFDTYDGVATPAAGYSGFAANGEKLCQHPYDPAWETLGNNGGHGGGTAEAFVKTVVTPLLLSPLPGMAGRGLG